MWLWIVAVILAGVAGYFLHGKFGSKKSEQFVTSTKNVKVSKDIAVDPRDEEEILDTAADQLAAATHKLAKSRPETTSK